MSDLRIAHSVLSEIFEGDPEPIPSWDRGDVAKLETCRGSIEVEAFGMRKYPDVEACAAKLLYSAIKLHAFPNGNKRFALVLVLVFLIKNDRRLTVAPGVNAETARRVAESNPHSAEGEPDLIIEGLTDFYRTNLEHHVWQRSAGSSAVRDPT
jgi:death-on-curing family protein